MHELKLWFVREVLSLEADLMQFLRHHGRNRSDLNDLRQEVYLRAYESAAERLPQSTRPFVFAIARNILVDQFRRERIIPIDGVPDSDAIEIPTDEPRFAGFTNTGNPRLATDSRTAERSSSHSLDRTTTCGMSGSPQPCSTSFM